MEFYQPLQGKQKSASTKPLEPEHTDLRLLYILSYGTAECGRFQSPTSLSLKM